MQLLGPTLLQSAARLHGHECSVVDFNALYIHPRASKRMVVGNFVRDHDKPMGLSSIQLVEKGVHEACRFGPENLLRLLTALVTMHGKSKV